MRVLLVGSGGREHALAWAMAKSPHCEKLYCAPGNAGIADSAECVDIGVEDLDGLAQRAGHAEARGGGGEDRVGAAEELGRFVVLARVVGIPGVEEELPGGRLVRVGLGLSGRSP